MARKNLDRRLGALMDTDVFVRPGRGWLKALRESLGMTTAQLAKRLGVAQSSVVGFEQAEASKAITLKTLERAARALDCTLVYALVPRKPLETVVQERANAVAHERMQAISHSMTLENQRVLDEDERAQLRRLALKLIDGPGSALWDEE
jgi:predicted DNA-binding mobile mystery protein A